LADALWAAAKAWKLIVDRVADDRAGHAVAAATAAAEFGGD
jgi:hypothetical protein